MVIHTKAKTKLHVKATQEIKAPEATVRGRNMMTVCRGPGITKKEVTIRSSSGLKSRYKTTGLEANTVRKAVRTEKERSYENTPNGLEHRQLAYKGEKQTVTQEGDVYCQYRKMKIGREGEIRKKSGSMKMAEAIGTKVALGQMEGGSELYDAYMVMDNLSKPATNALDAGKWLYRSQTVRAREKRIKKIESGKRLGKKAVKDSAVKAAKESAKAAVKNGTKKAVKETAKTTVRAIASTAGTAAGGVLLGLAAGEAAGIALDKRDIKNSTRNRMIQLFIAKLRQEDNRDSIGKAIKDMVTMRFFLIAKYLLRYVGLFFLCLFALVALITLPVLAIVAVIYNSPFAIFFPSISPGETTQQVLSTYMAEFNREIEAEVNNHSGYDRCEKIYLNVDDAEAPYNYWDILAVYMVNHGIGDTATDMTDKAKKNLKAVFDDMCSYHITSGTATEEDEEGNTITHSIKYVNVTLKTYRSMISVYGFNEDEQEILGELMRPEYLAMLGDMGSGSNPGGDH